MYLSYWKTEINSMYAFDTTVTVIEEVKGEVKDTVKEEVDMFADDFDLDDSMDFGNLTTYQSRV